MPRTAPTTDWTPDPAAAGSEQPAPTEPETRAGKLWARIVWLASWLLPPTLMAGAYTILALTSDTGAFGKSFMALGFGFVIVLWLVFRTAAESAGISRALSGGDADSLLAISTKQLRRRRRSSDASRAPFLIYKALAHELRNEPTDALAAATEAKPSREHHALLALAVRITSLVDLGRAAEAHTLAADLEALAARVDRRLQPMPHHYAHLARARLLAADAKLTEANAELSKVIDDVRA
ncbi:MAG TPA: hypothetical protein VMZ53_23450, partial [Kofleriaceae bacterium]|nr:hypothetical protein [Kofleriaceae bacterium]